MLVYIFKKRQFLWDPISDINSLYNYYQILDVLPVVSCGEIL